jgi:hypothetical protein
VAVLSAVELIKSIWRQSGINSQPSISFSWNSRTTELGISVKGYGDLFSALGSSISTMIGEFAVLQVTSFITSGFDSKYKCFGRRECKAVKKSGLYSTKYVSSSKDAKVFYSVFQHLLFRKNNANNKIHHKNIDDSSHSNAFEARKRPIYHSTNSGPTVE